MRTDRELLELAAKAVGMKIGKKPEVGERWSEGITYWRDGMCGYVAGVVEVTGFDREGPITKTWSPGYQDGDCARMEAEIGLNVEWWTDSVTVFRPGFAAANIQYGSHNGDKQAARRMASLRVAAEIGATVP